MPTEEKFEQTVLFTVRLVVELDDAITGPHNQHILVREVEKARNITQVLALKLFGSIAPLEVALGQHILVVLNFLFLLLQVVHMLDELEILHVVLPHTASVVPYIKLSFPWPFVIASDDRLIGFEIFEHIREHLGELSFGPVENPHIELGHDHEDFKVVVEVGVYGVGVLQEFHLVLCLSVDQVNQFFAYYDDRVVGEHHNFAEHWRFVFQVEHLDSIQSLDIPDA
jgi:hypothetical protein